MIKDIDKKNIRQIPSSQLRCEDEIMASWKGDINKVLLSINCITYNHEPYIEDALIGFLRQKTDFPIEILIHDDASTDGTADIIRKYERLYPNLIKPIYQTENQYSKGVRLMPYNAKRATGSYIAMCEGDDYWLDSKKLQKQVEFLEHNKDYVISGHDAFIINEQGEIISSSKLPLSQKRSFSAEDVSKGKAWILTMSWVYRNLFQEEVPERNMVKNGDTFFTSILGMYGGSYYHEDIKPAAYRVHARGVWSSLNTDVKKDEAINTWFWMYRYYRRVGQPILSSYYFNRFTRAVLAKASLATVVREVLFKLFKLQSLKSFIKKILGRRAFNKLKSGKA